MGIVSTASHPFSLFTASFYFSSLPLFCHPNLTFTCKFKIEVQFSGRGKNKI